MTDVIIAILAAGSLIYFGIMECIYSYRNPYPLFRNKDKRLSEIHKYATRSITKDV